MIFLFDCHSIDGDRSIATLSVFSSLYLIQSILLLLTSLENCWIGATHHPRLSSTSQSIDCSLTSLLLYPAARCHRQGREALSTVDCSCHVVIENMLLDMHGAFLVSMKRFGEVPMLPNFDPTTAIAHLS